MRKPVLAFSIMESARLSAYSIKCTIGISSGFASLPSRLNSKSVKWMSVPHLGYLLDHDYGIDKN
jgi:hypothetical protein